MSVAFLSLLATIANSSPFAHAGTAFTASPNENAAAAVSRCPRMIWHLKYDAAEHLTNNIGFQGPASRANIDRTMFLAHCFDELIYVVEHQSFQLGDVASTKKLSQDPSPF
jgi:hypothetical protein